MNGSRRRQQSGQSIIFVGIAIALLFGLLAAALDTGNLYQVRREMQNAADAGALAGAHELCFGSGTEAAAEAAAQQYAIDNGAVFPPSSRNATLSTGLVTVTAQITATTWLASMIGINQSQVGATAVAACGAATSACGLWPVTIREGDWNTFATQCGREFALWDDDNNNQQIVCQNYECDLFPLSTYPNNGGPSDILPDPSRAWLDFTNAIPPYQGVPCDQPGCGTNEQGCWIRNNGGAPIEINDCVGGTNGVRAGLRNDVNSRAGDIIQFPVFDINCAGSTNGNCSGRYRVSGFGCVEIVGYLRRGSGGSTQFPLQRKPGVTGVPPQLNVSLIHVRVSCDQSCNTTCGGTSGGGPPGPGGVAAVSLLR